MGPKRGADRGRSRGRAQQSSRSARRAVKEGDDIPEVYQDMLAEAARNPLLQPDVPNGAVKRRKLDDGSSKVTGSELALTGVSQSPTNVAGGVSENETTLSTTQKQTIIDDFCISEDGSDDDFEDVAIEADADVGHQAIADEPLQLDLSQKPGPDFTPSIRRRKPATAVERKLRLDVHKWHVLSLLAHLQQRNQWCEDEQVQSILKPLIPRKLVTLLHLDATQPQYQRNHSFITAINEISTIWRIEWKITEQGMRRAYWKEKSDDLENVDDLPDPIDQDDFREAARTRCGSRDLGAQLFCSLLRAVAVNTRLVCSFQPLPFSGVAKGTTAEKPKPQYIMASSLGLQPHGTENRGGSQPLNPGMRLYGAEPENSKTPPPSKRTLKSIKDSPYPIFWVEVFNEALQKWIPVDSLVRSTTNKPKTGFEPPASDLLNNMSYVIAFEDDGSAKDVTRRYVQFYNGKTRKNRVESTKGGEQWWKRTMLFYEKPFPEDRDAIEDAELLAREESEQMPKNVQDFKGHPHYALERHLRRNEVIHPRREIGKVSLGQSKDGKLEPVFRRRDVLVVRTADQWYRLGRDIKIREQPLKRIALQKRRGTVMEQPNEEIEAEGAMLYAEFQTQLYVPPNVVNGKIPKNVYGNLDVYVTSMIPAGGIHVQHPDAAKAARILGIDYADAVTGFEFKGKQGTAVFKGVVVAAEYRDAIVEVLEGLNYERAREINEKRSSIALQTWKKFLTALRIRERVNAKYAENEAGDDDDEDVTYQDEEEAAHDDDKDGGDGGGFFPVQTKDRSRTPQDTAPLDVQDDFLPGSIYEVEIPIVIHESPHKIPHEQPRGMTDHLQKTEATKNLNPLPAGTQHDQNDDQMEQGGGFVVDELSDHQDNTTTAEALPARLNTTTTTTTEAITPLTKINTTFTAYLRPDSNPLTTQPRPHHPSDLEPNTTIAVPNPNESHDKTPIPSPNQDDESDNDDELEKSSLLSHDPEDSDAEPDWLIQAVDSDAE